jgi:hypothetical protein
VLLRIAILSLSTEWRMSFDTEMITRLVVMR